MRGVVAEESENTHGRPMLSFEGFVGAGLKYTGACSNGGVMRVVVKQVVELLHVAMKKRHCLIRCCLVVEASAEIAWHGIVWYGILRLQCSTT